MKKIYQEPKNRVADLNVNGDMCQILLPASAGTPATQQTGVDDIVYDSNGLARTQTDVNVWDEEW